MIWDDEINDDYDFKRLRKDLETEYMIQGIGFVRKELNEENGKMLNPSQTENPAKSSYTIFPVLFGIPVCPPRKKCAEWLP